MRTIVIWTAAAVVLTAVSAPASADGTTEAITHAPITVMGDHTHEAGEVMLSYRFMHMPMEGSRVGTDEVSAADIFAANPAFLAVPTSMDMQMHMFGLMYAPADWLTLMAMGNYTSNTMDHVTRMGGAFTTESAGFGDVKLSGLITLHDDGLHHVHLNAGLSLPTGTIDATDAIPMGVVTLPYPMQIGSGTVDILPGLTYSGRDGAVAWGAQYLATIRTGTNDAGYTLGDVHQATAWLGYGIADWVSAGFRVAGRSLGRIDGSDARIQGGAPPFGVQTADPANQGGERIDLGFGLNFAVPRGGLAGNRLAVEFVLPVYQDLNGPQLETDWMLTAGWQYTF